MGANSAQGVRLQSAVQVICSLIVDGGAIRRRAVPTLETDLRFELAGCLLSSQARADSVDIALSQLSKQGIFSDERWRASDEAFESDVFCSLQSLPKSGGGTFSYRFPRVRARQLALIRDQLRTRSLQQRICANTNVRRKRADLVQDLPGIGPKHASMFLRNAGVTYDLAILDVHVVKYLQRLGLMQVNGSIRTLRAYEEVEAVAIRYAADFGQPVGVLDWAIWITMQAAKEIDV